MIIINTKKERVFDEIIIKLRYCLNETKKMFCEMLTVLANLRKTQSSLNVSEKDDISRNEKDGYKEKFNECDITQKNALPHIY